MRTFIVAVIAAGVLAGCSGTDSAKLVDTTSAPTSATPSTLAPIAVPADMLNPAVTQDTITMTICSTGYTATVRPAASVTDPLKRAQIVSYGYTDTSTANYEEDHVIALEIGGAASAPTNLFPQPNTTAKDDDGLESNLHGRVCSRAVTLAAAQSEMLVAKTAHGYGRAKSEAGGVTATTVATSPPVTAAKAAPAAPVTTAASTGGAYYANCAAAKAAGAAPLHMGSPGYRPALDRDGDGIACET